MSPLSDRDYVRGKHPPSCTCVDCSNERLIRLKKEVHPDYVSYCPRCGQKSLWHNLQEQKYECLNLKCKAVGNTVSEIQANYSSDEVIKKPVKSAVTSTIPKWLIPLLLIFASFLIGLVINALVRSIIPFWTLLGFSVVFTIEKWFIYYTRKNKWLGRFYRLILNLGILSLFGLIISLAIQLFSHHFAQGALIGSILLVCEIGFFIWLWNIVSKNSWRWPSMKLTVFTLISLFLVFSFAGVEPWSSYKDNSLSKMHSIFSSASNRQTSPTYSNALVTTSTNSIMSKTTAVPTHVTTTIIQTSALTQSITKGINAQTGIYKNYSLGLAGVSGNGCYDDTGNLIVLINNINATNPTYIQLINFLQQDKTDQFPYNYVLPASKMYYGTLESHVDLKNIQNIIEGTVKPKNPCICADFAERLHNNAEMAGIRCAFVDLDMTGYSDPYHLGISSTSGHACNAFQTTDRGLIYVDATGMLPTIPHPSRLVSTVNIVIGQQYIPINLFPEAGWLSAGQSMGVVTNIRVIWDGTWNNLK